jgi:DNA-directed RNA polymerase specialized sigma24 family protein
VGGLSYREIAERDRVSYRTVDKQLAKAPRRLRELCDQAA